MVRKFIQHISKSFSLCLVSQKPIKGNFAALKYSWWPRSCSSEPAKVNTVKELILFSNFISILLKLICLVQRMLWLSKVSLKKNILRIGIIKNSYLICAEDSQQIVACFGILGGMVLSSISEVKKIDT